MDIVRNSLSRLFALISKMNAPHFSDAASQRAVRIASRRKTVRRISVAGLAICLVAGVIAVEGPRQGGLLSRLGLGSSKSADVQAASLSDDEFKADLNNRRRGLQFTTGFYEFDDGPEEDVRKGRKSRNEMASTTAPYFAADYFEDRDLAASQGFFGFWASVQLGGKDDEAGREGGSGLANLASEAVPNFQRINRMRTSKERSSDSDREPLLSRIFGAHQNEPASEPPSSASTASPEGSMPPEPKTGKGVGGLLNKLFGR
ncbi:MAG: hypothetical protein ACI8UO_000199 [Verrucomicrobiales bacterium]|jgi:hypothetical protein